MKRFIIAIILVVIVIWGCFTTYNYLKNTVEELSSEIFKADQLVQNGDMEACAKAVYESYKNWKDREQLIGAIVRHQEMDDIESLYIRALQSANNKDKNEYLINSKELQGLLLHLKDMEKPVMKNLF